MRIPPYLATLALLLGAPAALARPTKAAPKEADSASLEPPLTIPEVGDTHTTHASVTPASSEPPAVTEPRDEAQSKARTRPEEERDATNAIVVVEPHVGIGSRSFEYVDRISTDLLWYDMPAAPRVGVSGEAYPLAAYRRDLVSGLGLSAAYASSLFLQSEGPAQRPVDTTWRSFDVALKMRVPIGTRGSVVFGKVGYGLVDFDFSHDASQLRSTTAPKRLPAVGYRFVRAGVDGRIAVWKIAVLAGADYLFVTDTGPMGELFPRATAGGVEAHIGAAYTLTSHLEVRSGLYYQRFFYDLKPEVGDANVAGGALDQLTRWETSLAFTF